MRLWKRKRKLDRCVVEEPLGEACPFQAARLVAFRSTSVCGMLRVCNWHASALARGPVEEAGDIGR